MAHLAPQDILEPGFEGRPVKTEEGATLKGYTLEDVEFILRLLAYNNTNYTRSSAILERDYGIKIHPTTLRKWVSSSYVQRYVQVQTELGNEINKKLATKTTDLAAKAVEAQDLALDRTINRISEISDDKLPSAVAALAGAASKSIESSALLNDRPTQIIKYKNPDEALKFLRERIT